MLGQSPHLIGGILWIQNPMRGMRPLVLHACTQLSYDRNEPWQRCLTLTRLSCLHISCTFPPPPAVLSSEHICKVAETQVFADYRSPSSGQKPHSLRIVCGCQSCELTSGFYIRICSAAGVAAVPSLQEGPGFKYQFKSQSLLFLCILQLWLDERLGTGCVSVWVSCDVVTTWTCSS